MEADLVDALKWYLVFLFSTSWHEAAHAWAAHKMGDDTAYRGGQVSLDPTPHIRREPVGMVVVPWLSYFMSGWMIGWASAPYQPGWALEHPRRAAWMALAGPGANVLIMLLAVLLMRVGMEWQVFHLSSAPSFRSVVVAVDNGAGIATFAARILSLAFSLNLLLAVFNLIPLPPLDGSNIPFLFLPREAAEKYRGALAQRGLAMIGLLIAWQLFGFVFPSVFSGALNVLYRLAPGG